MFPLTGIREGGQNVTDMKQVYHTIIKPESNGWFVGWVEEIPGAITQAPSLEECRESLRESLQLMLETHRDEARQCADESCILEAIEIDVNDELPSVPQQLA